LKNTHEVATQLAIVCFHYFDARTCIESENVA